MKIRSLFMFMAAAGILASCSKSEIVNPQSGTEEIKMKSSVITIDAATRMPYEGNDLSANPITALVLASESTFDYTTLRCEGTMTFNGTDAVLYNKPVTSGTPTYVNVADYVYLSGLYPATGWDLTSTAGEASFTLSGNEDVMFAAEKRTRLSDLQAATPVIAELAFNHQLTLIRLSIWGDAKAVDEEGIVINDIQLIKVNGNAIPAQVDVDLSANPQTVAFSGNAATLSSFYTGTDNVFTNAAHALVKTAAEEVAYTMVPPTDASDVADTYEYTFSVSYTDKNDMEVTAEVNVDLKDDSTSSVFNTNTKGYAFNITFKFVGNQIKATASVVDWVEGGSHEIEV